MFSTDSMPEVSGSIVGTYECIAAVGLKSTTGKVGCLALGLPERYAEAPSGLPAPYWPTYASCVFPRSFRSHHRSRPLVFSLFSNCNPTQLSCVSLSDILLFFFFSVNIHSLCRTFKFVKKKNYIFENILNIFFIPS